MPRPRKCRKVGFIPDVLEFVPKCDLKSNSDEIYMTLEELEAIRLSDLLKLDQIESAKNMDVSRATIQRILNCARNKIADSLINGKKIIIEGGDYEITTCNYICKRINDKFLNNQNKNCSSCESKNYKCKGNKEFCMKNCKRYRGDN